MAEDIAVSGLAFHENPRRILGGPQPGTLTDAVLFLMISSRASRGGIHLLVRFARRRYRRQSSSMTGGRHGRPAPGIL